MQVYAFRALDAAGRPTAGTMLADSPADGRQRLRQRGLRIELFEPTFHERRSRRQWLSSRGRRNEAVAEFARLLALLVRSGVPITEAVDVLAGQTRGRWQSVLRDVHGALTAGSTLAEAIGRHGDWFDGVFVGAVRVGEQAGTLDQSLAQLADYLLDKHALQARLTTALVYPAILLVVAAGVVLFLMSYVVPQILAVLVASGQELPVSTRVLKGISDFLVARWPVLLAAAGGVVAAFAALLRTVGGRRAWHTLLLRLPLVGVLLRKQLVARFAQQMSMLLSTGIPFVEALRTVRATTRNAVLDVELASVERAVEAGSDIAPTLDGSRVFPPLVARLVAVGQSSGELPETLAQLRAGYEAEVKVAVTRFTAALEPLLIVVMGAVVGFVIFATLMPILQATRVLV